MTLTSTKFLEYARAHARTFGIPLLRIVGTLEPPLDGIGRGEIQKKVNDVGLVDDIMRGLTLPLAEEKKTDLAVPQRPTERIAFKGKHFTDLINTINAEFLARRWSDGLPIVPPTEEAVELMLTGTDRPHDEVVAWLQPRFGKASVEKIAINAVMAGCLPVHMPALIAAVQAIAEPGFSLRGLLGTTNATSPLLVINGPVARELNINSGIGLLGPGWRANQTISRAIRLITITIAGAWPGVSQMATFGKWSAYCFAENEDRLPSGWQPLNVELGHAPGSNTVTVFSAAALHILTYTSDMPAEDLLRMHARLLTELGSHCSYRWDPVDYPGTDRLLVIAPQHADIYNRDGVTKDDVRNYIFEHARLPRREYRPGELRSLPKWVKDASDEEMIPVMYEPKSLNIIVAGGERGHSIYFPTWSSTMSSQTREIELPPNWKGLLAKYRREIWQVL